MKKTFENLKIKFNKVVGLPECFIELINECGDIVDDLLLTKNQLIAVSTLLGFELSKECIRKRVEKSELA